MVPFFVSEGCSELACIVPWRPRHFETALSGFLRVKGIGSVQDF